MPAKKSNTGWWLIAFVVAVNLVCWAPVYLERLNRQPRSYRPAPSPENIVPRPAPAQQQDRVAEEIRRQNELNRREIERQGELNRLHRDMPNYADYYHQRYGYGRN